MYLKSNRRGAGATGALKQARAAFEYPRRPHSLSAWRAEQLAKTAKVSIQPPLTVRTRRAYFDCRFGQLHVRTAFPTTGGFDEGVTLLCLHSREGSSRSFARFLPEIAADRSVYAPD